MSLEVRFLKDPPNLQLSFFILLEVDLRLKKVVSPFFKNDIVEIKYLLEDSSAKQILFFFPYSHRV